jgi:IS5 family transposase
MGTLSRQIWLTLYSRPSAVSDYPPLCECGQPLRYLGRDRAYVKYGLGTCCADGHAIRRWRIEDDVRLHPPLPRHTKKWDRLYDHRTAVERVNSRLKEHGRLRSLRHRGLAKARVHAALTLLVMVGGAVGMTQHGHRDFARSVVQLIA